MTGRGLLVLALGVAACESVLDLEDYQNAVEELCKCDAVIPQHGGECQETLENRLDGVSEAARAEWLSFYADKCEGTCERAYDCFQRTGTCAKFSCVEDNECCGFDEGMECVNQQCCGGEGAACAANADCCLGACDGGRCVGAGMPESAGSQ